MSGTKSLTIQIKGNAKDFTVAIDKAGKGLDDIGGTADGATGKLGGLGDKLKGLGSVAAIGFAAVGAAAVAGLAIVGDQLGKAFDIEKANDKLAAQLGATPKMAADFGKIAGNLYSKNYGESVSDVNEALKRVWQDGLVDENATGAEIEGITAKVMDLASAFDQDLGGTTRAVSALMRNGLAGSAGEAFDIITRGFQQGVDKSEDLLDTVNEYAPQFKQLGLTGSQAMGLLSQGLKGGARDADTVADALKEFAIRAQDGSKLTGESFKQLGLDGAAMSAAIAKGGPEAADALDKTLDKLRGIEDPAMRAQIAVGLFGTKAGDLQDSITALDPSEATAAMGDVAGAAEKMGTTLNDNASSKLESFKRTVQTNVTDFFANTVVPGLTSFADTFSKAFNGEEVDAGGVIGFAATLGELAREHMPKVQEAMTKFGEVLKGVFTWLGDHAEVVKGFAMVVGVLFAAGILIAVVMVGLLVAAIALVGAVMAAVGMAIGWVWSNVIQPAIEFVVNWFQTTAWPIIQSVAGFIGNVFSVIGDVISTVWNSVIRPAIEFVVNWFQTTAWPIIQSVAGFIGTVFGVLQGVVSAVWNAIRAVIQPVIDFISGTVWPAIQSAASSIGGAFDTLKSTVSTVWDGIKGAISGVVDFITGIPGKIRGIWDGIWDGLSSGLSGVIQRVKDLWNGFANTFKIELPLGGGTIGLPTFHTGGTFHAPTPGGTGLALLRDGEHVSTPGRQPSNDGTSSGDLMAMLAAISDRPIQVVIDGKVVATTSAKYGRRRDGALL